MLKEAYVAGCEAAEGYIEKVAGVNWRNSKFMNRMSEGVAKAQEGIRDYHKGAWSDLRGKTKIHESGKTRGGGTMETERAPKKGKEKILTHLRGAAKFTPHAAGVAAAGAGGYAMAKDKKKK